MVRVKFGTGFALFGEILSDVVAASQLLKIITPLKTVLWVHNFDYRNHSIRK
jgi:hypothetical protein